MNQPDNTELESFEFQGRIHLITQSSKIPDALKILGQESRLGFDTETKPAFKKGEFYLPCLLQLSSEEDCFLFRLQQTGFHEGLRELLAEKTITKAGVAIRDDLVGLKKIHPFQPESFVEIADLARLQGHEKLGLRNLSAALLGLHVSKKTRTTNWERPTLTEQQLKYAAGDAYLSLKLYEALESTQKL